MNQAPPTDETLRAQLLAGDSAALDGIFDLYGGLLHACLLAVTGDHHLAADALQDVFIRVAEAPRRVANAGSLPGYLLRMARNRGIDLLRRRKPALLPADAVAPVHTDDIDADVVRHALSRLPDEQRVVVVLKVVDGRTFADIAVLLGIPLNTAASRYRYGLEKLHGWLSEVSHATR